MRKLALAALATVALAGCGSHVAAPVTHSGIGTALTTRDNAPTALCHFGPIGCHHPDTYPNGNPEGTP